MKKSYVVAIGILCLVLTQDLTAIITPLLYLFANWVESNMTAKRGCVKNKTIESIINAFLEN